jgi:hypothetical protein
MLREDEFDIAVPELGDFMPARVLPSFRLKTKTTKTR